MTRAIVAWLATACLASCGYDSSGAGLDSGTDADTDTDADSDTDSDSDADSDTDPLNCAGGRYDESAGLCWQDPMASGDYNWQEATDYCEGLELAGHTDWALPTKADFAEMLGDCDDDHCNTCAVSETCSALFGSDYGCYWSSTPMDLEHAASANFENGLIAGYPYTMYRSVRCVRSGS